MAGAHEVEGRDGGGCSARAESTAHAEQVGVHQEAEPVLAPKAGAPNDAAEGSMSIMFDGQAEHTASGGDEEVARRTVIEEEAETEKIVRLTEERVDPQRVFVARR